METKNKILNIGELKEKLSVWKDEGKKIVFTNGCFDILHLGHVDYLEKASNLGDRLIVAVNTDSSVRNIKGKDRPVNDEYSRVRVLASLGFVDAVILFEEDTPYALIQQLKPDILVKGNDYLAENIVGADIVINSGGEIKTIKLVDGYSTTKLINRIKQV